MTYVVGSGAFLYNTYYYLPFFNVFGKENLESMMINVVEGANFLCLNFGSLKGKHEPSSVAAAATLIPVATRQTNTLQFNKF